MWACHEIAGTVNVMIEVEHQDSEVGPHEIHAGLAELEPDREERAEESENRAAGADRRDRTVG